MRPYKINPQTQEPEKHLPSIGYFIEELRKPKPKRKRSARWDELAEAVIKRDGKCQVCGFASHLQVHHIIPFHVAPEYELDPKNCITLCMSKQRCHFVYGHLSNWSSYNPELPFMPDIADFR